MRIGNKDKIYFSDLCGLHFDALHFTLNNCILPDLTVRMASLFSVMRKLSSLRKSKKLDELLRHPLITP